MAIRGGCDSLAAGPFAGAAAKAPCPRHRVHTPLRAPSRTTPRETESGAHDQVGQQSEPRLWPQPFGLARIFAHDFVAPLANIRDIDGG